MEDKTELKLNSSNFNIATRLLYIPNPQNSIQVDNVYRYFSINILTTTASLGSVTDKVPDGIYR
jgi:hypothetical protein